VRQASLSFRGTSAALAVFATFAHGTFPFDATPCATTIRSWVLRLGYAHLTRPLPQQHRWAWLIDHTVQIGSSKLFVIVGVVLDQVPFGVRPLELADLHLVAMVPMETSNQERVDAELEKAIARTGVPRQIASDGGSDLQKGIARFQQRHPQTMSVLDVAHHVANLLKHYWEKDLRWQAFSQRMQQTASTLRQSRSAHLLAPKLRNKARYMTVGKFVRFGCLIVRQLEQPQPNAAVVEHYGWVLEYAEALQGWREQYDLAQSTLRQVRVEGLFRQGASLLDEEWGKLAASNNPTTQLLRNRLRAYVGKWSGVLKVGERLVGSTEILESAFGVQKHLSGDQSGSGLTVLSVGLGAMLGEVTVEQVHVEMERVPEKAVEGWGKRMFGKTVQWLRRQLFQDCSPTPDSVPKSR
jgi:hypothetical protein